MKTFLLAAAACAALATPALAASDTTRDAQPAPSMRTADTATGTARAVHPVVGL